MRVLALETSTRSAKAMLYDSSIGVVRTEALPLGPEIASGGRADTEAVYRATLEAGRRAASGEAVEAVGLSGVWHSLALCDERLQPCGGTYTWDFTGPAEQCRLARADAALTETLYRRTGCVPHVTYMRETLRWLRGQGVSLDDKRLITQGAYTFRRMTGAWLETANMVSGTGLLNLNALQYDDCALEYAGITADRLGPIGDYRDIRPLRPEAAEALGIPSGIPVVPAHADGALNQFAAGGTSGKIMTVSVGTSGAVRMATERPVTARDRALWCYRGVTDYVAGGAVSSACNAVDWFRNTFLGGRLSYEALDEGAALRGDMPVFLPFVYGERNPGWRDDRTGIFTDIRPDCTVNDMYRALQAGILFNLRQCCEILVREIGRPQQILLSGGILNSRRWIRLAADIFALPITCQRTRDASVLGAAALALHAAGDAGAPLDDKGIAKDGGETVEPDPSDVKIAREVYSRWLSCYRASVPARQ